MDPNDKVLVDLKADALSLLKTAERDERKKVAKEKRLKAEEQVS